ncbi:MAG: hypothetical protein IPF72_03065 [Chitinophagaceae bacterium]|nr:hypothetical protein [Chitinophagaceae bacterium]
MKYFTGEDKNGSSCIAKEVLQKEFYDYLIFNTATCLLILQVEKAGASIWGWIKYFNNAVFDLGENTELKYYK